ncbi:MAG: iron ABC transporter permease [Verrucomicrobiales bacterium]
MRGRRAPPRSGVPSRLPKPATLIYLACAGFFALFFLVPVWATLKGAFVARGELTMDYFWEVFRNPIYLEGLFNAFKIAAFSTLGALALALPLALLASRYAFPGKAVLTSMILVPLILPPFVGAIGMRAILGPRGALNAFLESLGLADAADPTDWLGASRLAGVVLMNALHLYPILYLNISAALANLDPAMEEAAENLGCAPWRRLWRITLPLAMPGIFAGGTIVFIWSFTELGVPLMFDYTRVTSVQIFSEIKNLSGNPFPYALVAVTLLASTLVFAAGKLAFGRGAAAGAGRASMGRAEIALAPKLGWACAAAFGMVSFAALLPHLGVLLTSVSTDWYATVLPGKMTLDHISDALGNPLATTAIGNSVQYAFLAMALCLALGVGIAWIVERTQLPGRGLLDALSMLPLAVPGLVLAFGYLALSRKGQPFDFLMLGDNPILLLVIAYAVRRLPYVVRSAAAGFQQTSVTLEEAAQNLGCPPGRTVWRITLPLIAANLIAGALLAFAFFDARSLRLAHPRPAAGTLPGSPTQSTAWSAPWATLPHRRRPRLGDALPRRHHPRRLPAPRQKTRALFRM